MSDSPFGSMEKEVEYLLAKYPELRNSDRKLAVRYWEEIQGATISPSFKALYLTKRLVKDDAIKRVRARVQNTRGKYPPTDPRVLHKRHQRQEDIKDWAVSG